MIKGWYKVEGTYDFGGHTVVVNNAVTTKRMLFDEQKANMIFDNYHFEIHVSIKNNHIYYAAVEVNNRLSKITGTDGLESFRRPYDFILAIFLKIQSRLQIQHTIKTITTLGE